MLIRCSISNCLIFISFIIPIIFQIELFISNYFYTKEKIGSDNIIFKIFRFFLSYTLSIIFIIIIKCRVNSGWNNSIYNSLVSRRKKKNSIWINPLNIEQKKLVRGKKMKSFFFLILLSIVSIIPISFNEFIKDEDGKHDIFKEINKDLISGKLSLGIFFEIIFYIILSKILLKEKFYRHHFFSLGIISFILLIYTIIYIVKFKYNDYKIILAIFTHFIYSLFYCLYNTLGKQYMLLYFKSPYTSMLNIGLIICIIMIIVDGIVFFYSKYNSKIIVKFQRLNIHLFYIFSGDIMLVFLWNLGIWLTIYYFTPCHLIISESIYEMMYFTQLIIAEYDTIKKDNLLLLLVIFYIVSSIIILISSLILNEILILNCYNLNKYTKNKILERERLDTIFAEMITEDDKNTKKSHLGTNSNSPSMIDNNVSNNIIREKDFLDENN